MKLDRMNKPNVDDRGRFCSFNTVCGRNCSPRERDQCRWWDHQAPVSHAKETRMSNGHIISHTSANGCRLCGLKGPLLLTTRCPQADKHGE